MDLLYSIYIYTALASNEKNLFYNSEIYIGPSYAKKLLKKKKLSFLNLQ